ncbi:MAG: 4Fe-4S dicluster domain-containing protein [Bacteroides sp.]|nr:4Fe-4S dicluster domain-containing protein [Bacteroides sp.]MCI1683453.1 4Fe-4S dicluster domain-containing protein [Bacteroides sp.]
MLKKARICLAIIIFALITFCFLDFTETGNAHYYLSKIQFVPALLSSSLIILASLIILTLLLGRIYCSVICPMGIFQDIINWFAKKRKGKKRHFHYSPPRTLVRWGIVILCVLAFFSGLTVVIALLDPYSAFGRMMVNVFKPIYLSGNNLLANIFSSMGNYSFYRVNVALLSVPSFVIGICTFLLIGFLAWKYGRIWCNTLCPVGTILGFLSRFSLFKIRIDTEACNHCGVCSTKCKASCINNLEQKIDYSRCINCFDCLDDCRQHALSFTMPLRKTKQRQTSDESRRQFLIAGIATTTAVPNLMAKAKAVAASANGMKSDKRHNPITPPGSVSREHFLSHCTSCHLCVSKCPSHVLKPALMEYGIEGIMQPTVSFEKGFCNFDCTVCSDICPNGAILPLTKEQKHITQMGKVVFIKENCIVYRREKNCGACSEHCPTQAISMVPYKKGLTIPHVNTDICVGCGGCEYVCPAYPFRAVHIEGNTVQQKAKPFTEKKEEKIKVDDFGF